MSLSEAEAKGFFERGPDLECPASLKIDASWQPKVLRVKLHGVEQYQVRFYMYTDSQLNATAQHGYYRKKRKRTQQGLFDTLEEAEANKYRTVVSYVMAVSTRTTPAALAKRKRDVDSRQRAQRATDREADRELGGAG